MLSCHGIFISILLLNRKNGNVQRPRQSKGVAVGHSFGDSDDACLFYSLAVICTNVKMSVANRSIIANCSLVSSESLFAMRSAVAVLSTPRSSQSLVTDKTSQILTTVSRDAPAEPLSIVDINCGDRFMLSANLSWVHPACSLEIRILLPISVLSSFFLLMAFSPKIIC